MKEIYIQIPKQKAELPALIVTGVLCFVGFAFHFGFFGWPGGLIFLSIVLPILAFVYLKRRGEYFVSANKDGITWRQGIISRFIYIPWDYLQRVDYLEFEINFMLKETAQVVSFGTSGITEAQADELKSVISDILGERKAANPI